MKAIIEFDLSNSDDEYDHKIMLKASDMSLAISEFRDYLRTNYKYQSKPDTFDEIFEKFNELFKDFNDM